MRPASEIHSALDMLDSELSRTQNPQYQIARDVLAWVAGAHWTELNGGNNPWLVAFLLDDPPQISDVPPGAN